MNKKTVLFIIASIIISIFMQSGTIGADSLPSPWAKNEVNEAVAHELVHESLTNNYQTPIKRYEYVLLALAVLDHAGINIPNKEQYVFNDILDHPYQKEILKAYQAGVISGYGNGMFKPNAYITREEVAVLIVKLLKSLDIKELNSDKQGNFADAKKISYWAKDAISFCYENGIIKGVGKDENGLDKINPLGTATRQEAILLIYRLANQYKIINDTSVGSITIDQNITDISTERNPGDIFDLTGFSKQFSIETGQLVQKLDALENVYIVDMTDKSALIVFDKNTTIYLAEYENGIHLELNAVGNIDDHSVDVYIELLQTLNQNSVVIEKVENGISTLRVNQDRFNENIADRYFITGSIERINQKDSYTITYFEKLF